jgi:glutamyl-tRNA reductase
VAAAAAAGGAAKLGWLGLGIMGRPMVHNLVKGGHTVHVWNRTAAKAHDLKAACPPGAVTVCVRAMACPRPRPRCVLTLTGLCACTYGFSPPRLRRPRLCGTAASP